MAEDGAKEESEAATAPEIDIKWRHYAAEALREVGVLSMVFAALDATLYNVRLPLWGIGVWIVCGGLLVVLGIYQAPEVRK